MASNAKAWLHLLSGIAALVLHTAVEHLADINLDFFGIPRDDALPEFYRLRELTARHAAVDFATAQGNDFSHLPEAKQ